MENEGNAVLDLDNGWGAVEAFRPAVTAAKSKGALCLAQLQYPGRQVPDFMNPHPKSASSEHLGPCMNKSYGPPTPLSIDDINDLYRRYAWAAEQLMKAGADGIVLHGCHGYIITQFLSPLTNKRTDEVRYALCPRPLVKSRSTQYNGSLAHRARFLLELVAAITAVCPPSRFITAIKLNCSDFIDGGVTLAEYAVVARWLEDAGVDWFDISGGTYASPAWRGNIMPELLERPSVKANGAYFLAEARNLKRVLARAVLGTTGGWRDAHRMAEAVERGDVDMVGLARPLRVEPDLVNRILRGETRESHL
jgi:2,4-dienoyl-CoA reductase-like NADH-dependent reductase (Old Yellow Enzyme family)